MSRRSEQRLAGGTRPAAALAVAVAACVAVLVGVPASARLEVTVDQASAAGADAAPPTPPVAGAARLARTGRSLATQAPSGTLLTVRTTVHVDRAAIVTAALRDRRTGELIRPGRGSMLGRSPVASGAARLRTTTTGAALLPIRIRAPRASVVVSHGLVVIVTAKTTGGQRATLKIGVPRISLS